MMDQGGMKSSAPDQQAANDRGIVGISLALDVDAVGAPGRLIARSVAPYSPAYYAGIVSGDQIVAVDSQPVKGKGLSDVAKAIRGEVGTPVKLSLSRRGQAREVTLTRVEDISEHERHRVSGHGHMGGGGMMGMHGGMMSMCGGMMGGRHQNGSGGDSDGQNGMMGMMGNMGGMGQMMGGGDSMMQNEHQPPDSQFPKSSQPSPND